jgi:DNA-binding transcriptional MerR regulator
MTFSTSQVAEDAQVTFRCLQWWTERRVVSPVIEPSASGSGKVRSWTEEDLFKTMIVARMRSKGISLQRVRVCLRNLPMEKLRAQEDAVIIVRRKSMRICGEEAALRALDLETGPVCVVLIAPLLAMLEKEMRKKALQ